MVKLKNEDHRQPKPPQYTDQQIVEGIYRRSEPVVQWFFYKECEPDFRRLVEQFLKNISHTADFTADVYLHLCDKEYKILKTYQFQGAFKGWVGKCARHLAYHQWKNNSRLIEIPESETLYIVEVVDEGNSKKSEIKEYMRYALAQMKNEKHRRAIDLFFLQEYEPEEISRIMNIKIENFYNLKRRALIELATILRKEENYGK